MRAMALLVLGGLALLVAGSGGSLNSKAMAGDEPQRGGDVYIRGALDLPKTLDRILTDGTLGTVGAVVVAFEAASFAPPGGRTEFSAFYGFHEDIPHWSRAVAKAGGANAHFRLFAMTSQERDLIDMGVPKAEALLKKALEVRWAPDPKSKPFVPAATWMCDAVRAARKLTKAERVALIYVADRVLPEKTFERSENLETERTWRQRLLPVGTYFDEEAVGKRLADLACSFWPIAPEAHFEDFLPWAELPGMPWVSRPEIVSWPDFLRATGIDEDGDEFGMPDALIEEIIRQTGEGMTEAEKEALREMLRKAKRGKPGSEPSDDPSAPPRPPEPDQPKPEAPRPEVTGPDVPPVPVSLPPRVGGEGRFSSTTPTWFPKIGEVTPWNNHTPSGFGHWPFARAAALSKGRYLFYPFPPGKWLDTCPIAPPQLSDLAPELVKRGDFQRLGSGDLAWDALDQAVRAVRDPTPWDDAFSDTPWATGWGAFEGRKPLALEKRWQARRHPRDAAFGGYHPQERTLEKAGERLLEETIPAYNRAIRDLDERIAVLRAPNAPKAHPRALADLTLGRFWLSMSRFHLHALGLYGKEIARFKPDDPKESVGHYVITYVPTIRMSDVLDAYDGRVLEAAGELKYKRMVIGGVKGQQGNLLEIPVKNPDFRAKRAQERVLENMDERLVPHAVDMIESARKTMERYARTPWGWTTYYSVAYTFVWHPVPPDKGSTGPMGGVGPTPPSDDPDAPVTPGGGGGGSTGGGPATGGGGGR